MKDFIVKSIPQEQTHDWILNKHYAKRIPPIMFAFGLYDQDKDLQGVCTFGMPTRMFNSGFAIFGGRLEIATYELNRLVMNEGLPKNALSFFLGRCFKAFKKPTCLVSYADGNMQHHGYIYQATNWIFTGKTESRAKFVDKNGKEIHERTIWSRYGDEKNALASGEITKHVQGGKYRYFMFLGDKKQVKEMKNKLVYHIESYPKGDNKKYNASYSPKIQRILL